jgi:hypothetical protein
LLFSEQFSTAYFAVPILEGQRNATICREKLTHLLTSEHNPMAMTFRRELSPYLHHH